MNYSFCMNENSLHQDNYDNLKQLIQTNLKIMINELNQFKSEYSSIPYEYANMRLKFSEGKSLEFPYYYTISIRVIREFFGHISSLKQLKQFFTELKKRNLFDLEKNLMNPHLTLFGSFLRIYIQRLTEIDNVNNYKDLPPSSFDNDLFEKCWNQFLPWIASKPLKVKFYYFLNNLKIQGKSFCFNEKLNLRFVLPTKKEKTDLVEELSFKPSSFEGDIKCIQRITTIANCNAWIEGEVEISHEDLEKKFVAKDIIHPYFIEEILNLLGLSNTMVGFLAFIDPLSPKKITLQPQYEKEESYLLSSYYYQFPEWMEKSFSFPRFTLKLDEETKDLLISYPIVRRSFPPNGDLI